MKVWFVGLILVLAQGKKSSDPVPLLSSIDFNVGDTKVHMAVSSMVKLDADKLLAFAYNFTASYNKPLRVVVVTPRKGCMEKASSTEKADVENQYCRIPVEVPQGKPGGFGMAGTKNSKAVSQTVTALVFDEANAMLISKTIDIYWPSDRLEAPPASKP